MKPERTNISSEEVNESVDDVDISASQNLP